VAAILETGSGVADMALGTASPRDSHDSHFLALDLLNALDDQLGVPDDHRDPLVGLDGGQHYAQAYDGARYCHIPCYCCHASFGGLSSYCAFYILKLTKLDSQQIRLYYQLIQICNCADSLCHSLPLYSLLDPSPAFPECSALLHQPLSEQIILKSMDLSSS
jgi:hypothetical protein